MDHGLAFSAPHVRLQTIQFKSNLIREKHIFPGSVLVLSGPLQPVFMAFLVQQRFKVRAQARKPSFVQPRAHSSWRHLNNVASSIVHCWRTPPEQHASQAVFWGPADVTRERLSPTACATQGSCFFNTTQFGTKHENKKPQLFCKDVTDQDSIEERQRQASPLHLESTSSKEFCTSNLPRLQNKPPEN